jgi:hypothetical protein
LVWYNDINIQVAIITLISSVGVAILTSRLTLKNDERLKRLEQALNKQQTEDKARLDYEYEAKKRLYQEYEPLVFQLQEASESALTRIMNLARDAANGFLGPRGWLSYVDRYYLRSTVYRVFAPIALFKLMRARLTLFDLNLNSQFNNQYFLTKILFRTFAKDFTIADFAPKLDYKPYTEDVSPSISKKQGIVIGIIDNMTEALIEYDENDKIYRIISFGKFEKKLNEEKEFLGLFELAIDLFKDFNPGQYPVLWRILIIQAFIHKVIIDGAKSSLILSNIKFDQILLEERKKFDWRTKIEKTVKPEILYDQHFGAAAKYLEENIRSLQD